MVIQLLAGVASFHWGNFVIGANEEPPAPRCNSLLLPLSQPTRGLLDGEKSKFAFGSVNVTSRKKLLIAGFEPPRSVFTDSFVFEDENDLATSSSDSCHAHRCVTMQPLPAFNSGLSVRPSVYLPGYLPVLSYLSVGPPLFLSVYLSACPSTPVPVFISIHLVYTIYLSSCLIHSLSLIHI